MECRAFAFFRAPAKLSSELSCTSDATRTENIAEKTKTSPSNFLVRLACFKLDPDNKAVPPSRYPPHLQAASTTRQARTPRLGLADAQRTGPSAPHRLAPPRPSARTQLVTSPSAGGISPCCACALFNKLVSSKPSRNKTDRGHVRQLSDAHDTLSPTSTPPRRRCARPSASPHAPRTASRPPADPVRYAHPQPRSR